VSARPLVDPAAVRGGDRRALARLLTRLDDGAAEAEAALAALYPDTGRAHLLGLTGPPGSGKSSLANELAKAFRRAQPPLTVAILAVDPSSPFTGGAILGDRIRMRDLAGDPGIFIRSLASRGSLGGLSAAAADMARALDAAGFDRIIIETVGAGQSEVEVARLAHTTLVVEAPGLGDDVQAIKAGLLEAADVLVVNKADQPGADAAVRALRASLDLAHPVQRRWLAEAVGHHGAAALPAGEAPAQDARAWTPPIVQTVAPQGKGLEALLDAIERHRHHLAASGERAVRERERLAHELRRRLRDRLLASLLAQVGPAALDDALDRLVRREVDPAAAARELAEKVL
jgi:LAO/AO transport system kinase